MTVRASCGRGWCPKLKLQGLEEAGVGAGVEDFAYQGVDGADDRSGQYEPDHIAVDPCVDSVNRVGKSE